MKHFFVRRAGLAATLSLLTAAAWAQSAGTQWTKDGYGYLKVRPYSVVQLDIRQPGQARTLLSKRQLTPAGQTVPLEVRRVALSDDGRLILLNTNTKKVWRYDTLGDYWVYNTGSK